MFVGCRRRGVGLERGEVEARVLPGDHLLHPDNRLDQRVRTMFDCLLHNG